MSGVRGGSRAYPVDEFLQALTAQLDRAQDALALKVTGTQRPLTWALKDLAIDLRVFVEVTDQGRVTWRSAGPGEDGASTVHLSLTTITRPMVEENSFQVHRDQDPRGITQIAADASLDLDEQRKLEWMGVRTVGQLRNLDPVAVEAIVGIPVARLQAALAAAARPAVLTQQVVQRGDRTLLALHGANLADGTAPEVRLAGSPVEVVEWKPNRLLVKPQAHHVDGALEVRTSSGVARGFFDLGPDRNGQRANGAAAHGAASRAPAPTSPPAGGEP